MQSMTIANVISIIGKVPVPEVNCCNYIAITDPESGGGRQIQKGIETKLLIGFLF